MIYHHLFDKFRKQDEVQAAVIGAGHFGTAVVTQQNYTQRLRIVAVCDRQLESAKQAFLKAEIPEEKIAYCNDPQQAQQWIDDGGYVYTDDAMILMDIASIDIICEGTGVPEAGARYCKCALEKGKHIAAISKEMDSVIGPILKKMADERGLT